MVWLRWRYSGGFSMLEVLVALLVISILGIGMIRSIVALKSQNYSIQRFLLTHSSLFETQLFLQRQLSHSKPESIIITPQSLHWEQYDKLFLANAQGDYMDFSLHTTPMNLTYRDRKLYFNGALLLHNVASMRFWRDTIGQYNILSYQICTTICITDSLLLEFIEESIAIP